VVVADPIAKFSIRPLKKADTEALIRIAESAGNGMRDAEAWSNYLKLVEQGGLVALVATNGSKVVAYSMTNAVPGLPDHRLLRVVVLPEYQRHQIGTSLIRATAKQFSTQKVKRLLVRLDQADEVARQFIEYNQFTHQHRDIHMWLDNLKNVPRVTLPPGMRLKTSSPNQLENNFSHYHTLAFADRPRFQPFSVADVNKEKNENFQHEDIMLLETLKGQPIGFVWSMLWQYPKEKVVQIEPMGVVPEFRGKGLGRLLLNLGLDYGRKRGATSAELWTSDDNAVAVSLYTHTGFKIVGGFDFYYLPLSRDQL
jgi:mycothiol synthase